MTVDDEKNFESSNKCLICGGLYAEGDNEVRSHDHVTGNYKGSAHKICNINLRLTKRIPVIFQNFRGCDSHLITQKIGEIDVKIDVIPNIRKIRKYMD